jgi:anoctamin-10
MALLNNVIEFPSDAFKIVTHFRRPLPHRTDTIGPWLDCLSFLAWLSALTNSALVYLFHPRSGTAETSPLSVTHAQDVLARALFIALAASHGYIVLRAAVRHVLERVLWYGSPEKARLDASAREVKARYLQSVEGPTALGASVSAGVDVGVGVDATAKDEVASVPAGGEPSTPPLPPLPRSQPATPPPGEFWQFDEGVDEIRKSIKDA